MVLGKHSPSVVLLALRSPILSLLSCCFGLIASIIVPEALQGVVEYDPNRY